MKISHNLSLSKSAARKWFARFCTENFDVKDELRSGRPITEKSDEIIEKVEHDKHVEIARELGIDKTVLNHLHKTGYKKKLNVWVPRELSVKNMIDRINICDTLLKRNEIEPFLKRMITGDEKWITYDNRTRKRSWIKEGEKAQAIAKPGLTTKKVMLCVGRESFMSCYRSNN
ncbi:PREDICTED: histone-lysine N-methyltransferase SETMAR-like [Acromyrmex echinatior]|uniref:histone-lysine N-methyltransferase SETMAR-like n=1 Tax=Acromyrmex echinatior TaxID=103372 RepID=UPI000580FA54|nr:PREDICTED: histone-lysine N-methyltransferase SETMAR-like [Acromyrmex echinatior]